MSEMVADCGRKPLIGFLRSGVCGNDGWYGDADEDGDTDSVHYAHSQVATTLSSRERVDCGSLSSIQISCDMAATMRQATRLPCANG